MNDKKVHADAKLKAVWVRPELSQIEAGSAESGTANIRDGGGGVQAS